MTPAPKKYRVLSALTLFSLLAVGAPPTEAQDLRYTSVTEAEFGGTLGRMMSAMPGIDTEVRETTWISGPRMRTDSEGASTIMDWEAGRMVGIDHETRTYWTVDLADFGRSMRAMTDAATEDAREAPVQRGEAEARQGEPTRRMEIHVSTDRTGDTREISGFRTERVFLTIEMESEEQVAGDDPENPETREGKMVLLNELWVTEENLMAVPEEMDLEGYREMASATEDDWAAMQQAFATDPDLEVAFDRSRAALEDLDGTAVESTMFWVLVPPDQDFDRQAALDDRDRSLSSDVADAAKASAAESAKDAVKSGLGRVGGLFGGDDEEEEEEGEAPQPVQQTLVRIKTLLEEVERGPIPASKFEVPEGSFEMAVGDVVTVSGTDLSIEFWNVDEDSRCPLDVTCVWEGRVVVTLRVRRGGGSPQDVRLTTVALEGAPGSKSAQVGDFLITLQDVSPAPSTSEPLKISDYRITISVERVN